MTHRILLATSKHQTWVRNVEAAVSVQFGIDRVPDRGEVFIELIPAIHVLEIMKRNQARDNRERVCFWSVTCLEEAELGAPLIRPGKPFLGIDITLGWRSRICSGLDIRSRRSGIIFMIAIEPTNPVEHRGDKRIAVVGELALTDYSSNSVSKLVRFLV